MDLIYDEVHSTAPTEVSAVQTFCHDRGEINPLMLRKKTCWSATALFSVNMHLVEGESFLTLEISRSCGRARVTGKVR